MKAPPRGPSRRPQTPAITIGETSLDLRERAPEELDAELVAITGCSAAEIRAALAWRCLAGTLAAALIPLLADPPARHELAEAIEAAGVGEVQRQIRELYDAAGAEAHASPAAPAENEKEVPGGDAQG